MFVNKLKMDGIAEAVKKCMDEDDLEETGLRKAAYAAHTKGEKMFSFKGKTYPVKVQGEEVVTEAKGIPVAHGYMMQQKHTGKYRIHSPSGEHVGDVEKEGNMYRYHGSSNPNWPGTESHKDYQTDKVENKHEAGDIVAHLHHSGMKNEEVEKESCEDEVKKHEKRLHGKDGEVGKHVNKMHKEEIEELDEKNVPNSPEKWAQAKSQAKAKFDVYPSAYANGWASKKYKSMGGTWRTESVEHIEEKELSDKQKKIAKLEHPKDKIDAGDLAKLRGEETFTEAEKVLTATGMKVFGSSYGDSAKARRDQVKKDIDTIKGPTTKQLVGVKKEKVKKEEFFKDRLITNYIEEEAAFEAELQEVLSKDASAGDYISDFVHSDNPKFAGKSVKKRQKMALAAYYAKKNESVDDSYPVTTDTVAGRMPGGMANTFKQFKVKVSAKDKEAAETLNQIHNSNPMNMTASEPHVGHGGLVSIPPAGVVHKEEVELDEATPPKNTDIADKSYLKDAGKKPTVKSDIKNFGRFLAGKKETNEGKQPESDTVPFITDSDKPPFDGPYTKTPSNVKDKSGAVHTPMSRAKDLAKAAMKRVKTEMLGKAPGNNG